MTTTVGDALDDQLARRLRAARADLVHALEPHRGALFTFCRGLTRNVWDAEDLVQDTLARAMTTLAGTFETVQDPRGWLFRVAHNLAVDEWRRHRPLPVADLPDSAAPPGPDAGEWRDALGTVALLPPQERAAFVLREAFGCTAPEIADVLGTTVGAVKTALHRGRRRVAGELPTAADPAPTALLDRLAAAFATYDVEVVAALFAERATVDIVGTAVERGRDVIRAGSLTHMLVVEAPRVRYHAEPARVDGDAVLALYEQTASGPGPLADLLRVEELDGRIGVVRWYYYCPEVIEHAARELGVPARTHGHLDR